MSLSHILESLNSGSSRPASHASSSDNSTFNEYEAVPEEFRLVLDPLFEKGLEYLKSATKVNTKAVGGTQIKTILAPRINSLADQGISEEFELNSKDAWVALVNSARCAHALFTMCHMLHGDISPSSVCYYFKENGTITGVLSDHDDHDPEEVRRNEKASKVRAFWVLSLTTGCA
ncbi:hypothetical protein DFH11DRAFT_1569366 [Phellopilus nigrolimitatus]|nr:hypothetical protein DFH11DRAFT_1569366 [Phellopilus nigrolimitatus]